MKLEIVKETKVNDNPWYAIYKDGKYKMGSYDLEKVEQMFNNAISDPNYFEEKKEVLKSCEIVVSLQS